jgi:hypothetical protein
MTRNILILFYLVAFFSNTLFAQSDKNVITKTNDSLYYIDAEEKNENIASNFKKQLKALENFEVGGYYRFMSNYRRMNNSYSNISANRTNIFVGDDSQIPQLSLNLKGYANSKTSFGTDLFLWTPMTGAGEKENVKGLNLGVSLNGSFSTDHGNFTVTAGGINWYALSPFTFQTSRGNNRYSLFDRNPWDPNTGKIDGRYSDYYSSGAINQDQRWGNQAFHGLIVEGAQLPLDLTVSGMYGRTQFDGGFSAKANTSGGGRIVKTYTHGKNFISLNTFNNETYLDSLTTLKTGFNMFTVEQTHYFNNIKLYSEIGAGRKIVPNATSKWGEAISIKASTNIRKKVYTEVHLFRISPNVFNNTSVFMNSSIQQTVQVNNTQTQPVLIPVSSALLSMGQLSNNRQGIEINSQVDIGKVKTSIGYSNSMELENLSNTITYTHAFNNLALSRFYRWDFPSNVGPYGNLNKIYRAVYETLNLTDLDATGKPLFKKYFNTIEINSKYKTSLFGKEFYLFYLGSFNSIQDYAAPMVVFTEKALLRAYYHQIESYWKLNSRLVWTNYVSFERIIANYKTVTDVDSRRPKNQQGISIASGIDIQLSKGVGLYFRERWMTYKDKSFALDKYDGFESTLELKVFF